MEDVIEFEKAAHEDEPPTDIDTDTELQDVGEADFMLQFDLVFKHFKKLYQIYRIQYRATQLVIQCIILFK